MIDKLRNATIQIHGLQNVDDKYTFYYDETNNYRLTRIGELGFNSDTSDFFILGGFVCDSLPNASDIDLLFEQLGFNSEMSELKFKNICNKDFKMDKFLTLSKLSIYLDWVNSKKLNVHFFYADLIYYSIVDILDSIMITNKITDSHIYKSSLYESLASTGQSLIDFLYKFDYPNVVDPKLFIFELYNLIATAPTRDNNTSIILDNIYESESKDMPLLTNNKKHITIESFRPFYEQNIFLFKNSFHILDEEKSIEKLIRSSPILENATNYKFIDSKDDRMVQLSDIFVGVLRKLFEFINDNTEQQLRDKFTVFNLEQKKNLAYIQSLLSRSIHKNKAYKSSVSSIGFEEKLNLFLEFNF